MNGKEIVQKLGLTEHPEGGFYKETYRSVQCIKTDQNKIRNISTAIFFLLENDSKSLFHRIQSDELWFFHQGESLEIVFIKDGLSNTIILGNNLEDGEILQATIPANTWFRSRVKNSKGYALVSCTVAPGFDFADFELAKREELIQEFPHLKEIIQTFAKE
ncbi:MAG: cupin domain-containing protein [Bacteroidota bacterium]|nr:cupin domain-containing protein [Bacteroidota bacterium]